MCGGTNWEEKPSDRNETLIFVHSILGNKLVLRGVVKVGWVLSGVICVCF